jgi:hypothetical protein
VRVDLVQLRISPRSTAELLSSESRRRARARRGGPRSACWRLRSASAGAPANLCDGSSDPRRASGGSARASGMVRHPAHRRPRQSRANLPQGAKVVRPVGRLHLDALRQARSTVCGSTADGVPGEGWVGSIALRTHVLASLKTPPRQAPGSAMRLASRTAVVTPRGRERGGLVRAANVQLATAIMGI